jgi:hypothetical protein
MFAMQKGEVNPATPAAATAHGSSSTQRTSDSTTGTPSSYREWTKGGFVYNKVGPNFVPVHPNDHENKENLQIRLQHGDHLNLTPVKSTVNKLIHPSLSDGLDPQQVLHGEGIDLKKPSDILWITGNMAGKTYGQFGLQGTQRTEIGDAVETPPGTATLRPSPDQMHRFQKAAVLIDKLIQKEQECPSMGFTYAPESSEEQVDNKIKKEAAGGRPFNAKEHHKGKLILGYNPFKRTKKGWRNYTMKIADLLYYLDADLAEFVIAYCKGLARIIGCPYDCIANWTIIIIRYRKGSGFVFHIDGIADFGNYPGMVFNLNLSLHAHPKYFDLIDLRARSNLDAVRFTLQQFDTSVMTGVPRILYAHGLPANVPYELTTLAVKCPENPLEFKHPWVKEIQIIFPPLVFAKRIQYIDADEWFKHQAKTKRAARKP